MTDETTPAERWVPVIGWEGFYEVSDLGRVKSLARVTHRGAKLAERVLKTASKSYPTVGLHRDGVAKTVNVHALVAEAFLGPKPPGFVIRHTNGDRTDSSLGNLAYVPAAESTEVGRRLGPKAMASKSHCKRGHEFTSENTHVNGAGHRACRKCRAEGDARRRSSMPVEERS